MVLGTGVEDTTTHGTNGEAGGPGRAGVRGLRTIGRSRTPYQSFYQTSYRGGCYSRCRSRCHREESSAGDLVGENYSTRAVAHALRTHFSDADLRKQDHGRRQHEFWGETADDDTDAEHAETDHGFAAGELLNEEGFTAWTEAQDEINEAMAVINHGRRTLKEARAKQHSVNKLSRQYFKSYNRGGPSSSSTASSGPPRNRDEAITCLKCGKLGHRASNCPQPQAANRVEEESAAFTFYSELGHPKHRLHYGFGKGDVLELPEDREEPRPEH